MAKQILTNHGKLVSFCDSGKGFMDGEAVSASFDPNRCGYFEDMTDDDAPVYVCVGANTSDKKLQSVAGRLGIAFNAMADFRATLSVRLN